MNSAAATAAVKVCWSQSKPTLAQSFGEDSSSDEEERQRQLFRNTGLERARRTLEKLRERRERLEQVEKERSLSYLFFQQALWKDGLNCFSFSFRVATDAPGLVKCHFRYGATSLASQITCKTNKSTP